MFDPHTCMYVLSLCLHVNRACYKLVIMSLIDNLVHAHQSFLVLKQNQELQEASKHHPMNYSAPLVMVSCHNGITESLAS